MALEKMDESGKVVWSNLQRARNNGAKIDRDASKAVISAIVKPAGDGRSR